MPPYIFLDFGFSDNILQHLLNTSEIVPKGIFLELGCYFPKYDSINDPLSLTRCPASISELEEEKQNKGRSFKGKRQSGEGVVARDTI